MAKGPRFAPRTAKPKQPTTVTEGAPHVRAFMLKLIDKQDGMAADWPMISDTLAKEDFAALDLATADPRTAPLALSIARRIHTGAYDWITATTGEGFKDTAPIAPAMPSSDYAGPRHHFSDKPKT